MKRLSCHMDTLYGTTNIKKELMYVRRGVPMVANRNWEQLNQSRPLDAEHPDAVTILMLIIFKLLLIIITLPPI